MDLPEGVLVELLPGLAGDGDGRGTVGRHGAGVEAVAPQFGEDGGVAPWLRSARTRRNTNRMTGRLFQTRRRRCHCESKRAVTAVAASTR